MKISRKLEYACRVLAQLGRKDSVSGLVHIEHLAQAESIPSNYLVQILNRLRLKGLIISKRGQQGGYGLAKDPDQISFYAIVMAVDPESLKISCEQKGESGMKVSEVWDELSRKWVDQLKAISLESIISNIDSKMYYI